MGTWRGWALGSISLAAGCASIIDFDEPFEHTGGASSTSSGTTSSSTTSSSTTSSTTSTTSSASCEPTTSCQTLGFKCGTLFDGCKDNSCGLCAAPFMCGDTHTCICPSGVTAHPTLVADTAIQHNSSWVCGSLTAGDFPCINVSQYLDDARALLRFSIDAATRKALITPGSVTAAKLTLRPAAMCGGSSFTPAGKVQVYLLRSDWDEMTARWCHRSGPQNDTTTAPWGMQGAADATLDHGPLAAEVDLPTDNMPFDIDLDPSKLVSALVGATGVSLLLITPPGSKLVIQTKEGGAPATLDIEYCPTP